MPARVLINASGMKISKAGIDVLTNTNPQALSFDSSVFGLGLLQTGLVALAADGLFNNATRTTITFPNLGYVPVVLLMSYEPTGNYFNSDFRQWAPPYYVVYGGSGNIPGGGIAYTVSQTSLTIAGIRGYGQQACRYFIFYHG